jgi:hypothetical protein
MRASGTTFPLCPSTSDVNLSRHYQGVIDLDSGIPDQAFDLGMPEQKLEDPRIACPSIHQGRFCSSQ